MRSWTSTTRPEEAAYRAQAREWLEANAPEARAARDREGRRHDDGRVQGLAGQEGRRRLRPDHLAQGMGRAGRHADPAGDLQPGGGQVSGAAEPVPDRPGHVRADGDDLRATRRPRSASSGRPLRGEEIWCQLFSEPSGGSDVAAARTKAVRAPDGSGDWLINGQKVWTTGAQFSDFGIVVCRTDPDAPKHKGLTMFWLDMHDPGVEVRPIHQMSGGSGFNEVFFTDVRVKDSQRLGAVDDGWKVSLVTLMNERLAVGGASGAGWTEFMEPAREPAGPGRRAGAEGPGAAREAGRLVRPGRGAEAHPQPHHDGAVARPDAGAGELDRQDRLGRCRCRTWAIRRSRCWTSSGSSTIRSWPRCRRRSTTR